MNPDDLLAQQQAVLTQALNQQHDAFWFMLLFSVAGLVVSVWVLYMFYAKLRDIGDDVRRLRILFEFSHSPEAKGRPGQNPEASAKAEVDSRYKPKG